MGRNGIDAPTSDKFPFDQSVEAQNVDYRNGGLGRRRGGAYDVAANTSGSGFTAPLVALARHVPGGDETASEIWAWENAAPGNIARLIPPSTVWDTISGGVTYTGSISKTTTVSFNAKHYIFHDGAVDRSKVYDAGLDTIRYVGMGVPAAPTVANTGAGAYAATLRYYRVRFLQLSGAIIIRKGEPSPSVSFTPSGAGLAARVTKPATISESETHWDVEASPDNVNFYVLQANLPVGTTTYDDATAVSAYSTFPLTRVSGTFTLVPSARYGTTDGNRLIIFNIFETGHGSRVMWTPVLGSLDEGDDERLFQTSTIKPFQDLDEKNGGDGTGIAQINGVIYAFKFRQVWRGDPTGDIEKPYRFRRLSGIVGAVSHKSIALGEDAVGNPALYFMSHKGPYRINHTGSPSPSQIEYVGRDIEDLTRTNSGLPNINTVATTVISHAVFHSDLAQYWVWYSTGSNNSPDKLSVLDVKKAIRRDEYGVRGGWTTFTGLIATAVDSVMGPYALVATASLRPWVALPGNNKLAICDRDDIFTDTGTSFQAYVKTRSVAEFGRYLRVGETILLAKSHVSGTLTIRQTLDRDFGKETSTADVTIAVGDIDKTVIRKFEASTIAEAASVQIQLGDSAAVSSQWELRQLKVPIFMGGDIGGV